MGDSTEIFQMLNEMEFPPDVSLMDLEDFEIVDTRRILPSKMTGGFPQQDVSIGEVNGRRTPTLNEFCTLNEFATLNEFSLFDRVLPVQIPSATASATTSNETSPIVSPKPVSTVGKNGRQINPIPRYKRTCHISAELRRRSKIQDCLETLHTMVPMSKSGSKDSKAMQLLKVADHIRGMEATCKSHTQQLGSLRQDIATINAQLADLQCQLPDSGVDTLPEVTRSNPDKLNELYEDYTCTRTYSNWKFWMFSHLMRPLFDSYVTTVDTSTTPNFVGSIGSWLSSHLSLSNLRPLMTHSLLHILRKRVSKSGSKVVAGGGKGAPTGNCPGKVVGPMGNCPGKATGSMVNCGLGKATGAMGNCPGKAPGPTGNSGPGKTTGPMMNCGEKAAGPAGNSGLGKTTGPAGNCGPGKTTGPAGICGPTRNFVGKAAGPPAGNCVGKCGPLGNCPGRAGPTGDCTGKGGPPGDLGTRSGGHSM